MKLEKITSRENQRLIRLRKVRDGKMRSLIFIEGRRLVSEALRSDIKAVECFVIEGFGDVKLLYAIADLNIEVVELAEPLFRSIAATEESQGIILLAERPQGDFTIQDCSDAKIPVFVYLKEVNNPSNLGAILRSVEAAGAGGVFVSTNSADVFSPKALRASMGAAFRIPVRVNADLTRTIREAAAAEVECLALDASADRSYLDIDWRKPHLLIFGSEAHGLSEVEIEQIGGAISIPIETEVESLNLAVAAGVVLFEARRQATS